MRTLVLMLLAAVPVIAVELKPLTADRFDRYTHQAEERLEKRKSFLWVDESPDRVRRARQGQVVVEPSGEKALTQVESGLIHDWVGAVFIPGVTLERTLALVRDYDRHKDYYKPEVIDSRVLSHQDNAYRIYLRLRKKQVITVVLDTEHAVEYFPLDQTHWRSASRTTRISEVENAGKPDERILPPGSGEGFLWRLNSYWRFQERDGGTWVECEAISLTRDIPTGLNWIIQPIIRNLPRESLENTLKATRAALVK
jgi:hypothetical protein